MVDEVKVPEPWSEKEKRATKLTRPFLRVEWATEWLAYRLSQWALVDLLKVVANFSILAVAIQYAWTADERRQAQEDQRKAKHYQAWQAINTATGHTGSGGRVDALEDLNSDNVSLAAIYLKDAWLRGVHLPGADLMAAELEAADFTGAQLPGANLFGANLKNANLSNANLRGAVLLGADLTGAQLLGTDLAGAKLTGAKLNGALVAFADLSGSYLIRVSFEKARVIGSNLAGSDLSEADLREAEFSDSILDEANLNGVKNLHDIKSLERTHIHGIKNVPADFPRWAMDARGADDRAVPPNEWAENRKKFRIEILIQNSNIKN